MRVLLPIMLLATSLMAPLHASGAYPDAASDRAHIQQLVEHFRTAIIAKDGAALRGMFLPGGSWLQGLDQASMALVMAKKPDVQQFMPGNYEQFAKFVTAAPQAVEEKFHNVRIETDGTVGMVYFDYQFLQGGRLQNHGVETWQLAHTKEGWKISAMLYSVSLDDIR